MSRSPRKRPAARTADRYTLYTEAVQSPDSEVDFFRRIYRRHNGRAPLVMREDFCGTAAICCDWVRRGARNRSIGVDLDPEPLAWGRERYLQKLTPKQAARVALIQADVLEVETGPVDAILALNFSYCVFKRRPVLLSYLRRARGALSRGGIMVMDLYGGPEAQKPQEDKSRKKGFTYVWDQRQYNPITNETLNYIHFLFPDGSSMMKAFTYDWRLWALVELHEALLEAGFRETEVYWEGTDAKGEGSGVFRLRRKVPVEDAWIAYIVGLA